MPEKTYIDHSPFGDNDFNDWEKESNGYKLITAIDGENHYARYPEDHTVPLMGDVLKKTISGFKKGAHYRFSIDAKRLYEYELLQTWVSLTVDDIARAPSHAVSLPTWETISLDFVATQETHTLLISCYDRLARNNDCEPTETPDFEMRAANIALDFIRVFELAQHTESFNDYPDVHIQPSEIFEATHMSLGLAADQPGSIAVHHALGEEASATPSKVLCLGHNGGNVYPAQTTEMALHGLYQRVTLNWLDIQQPATAMAFDINDSVLDVQHIVPQARETISRMVQLVAPREKLIQRVELTCRNRTSIDRVELEIE